MPAPKGNQNAAKGAEWRSAIKRALARKSGENWRKGLDKVAEKFIEAAEKGDPWAMKEIGDRIDGKPAQSVTLSGDEDKPLITRIERRIIHDNAGD